MGQQFEDDIPPAVACARCGQSTCEGCAGSVEPRSINPLADHEQRDQLAWEVSENHSYAQRLVYTALVVAHPDQSYLEFPPQASLARAFHFAVVCEALAIGSFAVPWALGFALLFPGLSIELLASYQIITIVFGVFVVLVVGVVLLHLLWGWALEWAIMRRGLMPRYAWGQRFGLYACGWDLLASPAGLALVSTMSGWGAAKRAAKHGISVPKIALYAYLSKTRHIAPALHRSILWHSFAISGPIFFGAILVVPAYLIWHWVSSPWF